MNSNQKSDYKPFDFTLIMHSYSNYMRREPLLTYLAHFRGVGSMWGGEHLLETQKDYTVEQSSSVNSNFPLYCKLH